MDEVKVESVVGLGTKVTMKKMLKKEEKQEETNRPFENQGS